MRAVEANGYPVHSARSDTPLHGVSDMSDGNSALEREAQELGISAGQLKAIIVRVGTDRHKIAAAARRISDSTRGAPATAAMCQVVAI